MIDIALSRFMDTFSMMAFSKLFSSEIQDLFLILVKVNLFASYFKKERLLYWKMDSRMLHWPYPYLFFDVQMRKFLADQ